MIASEWRALLSLNPLSFGIDRYPRLPTQLFIWVWAPAALLPTGPAVQTLTPVKTPTHDILMEGPDPFLVRPSQPSHRSVWPEPSVIGTPAWAP